MLSAGHRRAPQAHTGASRLTWRRRQRPQRACSEARAPQGASTKAAAKAAQGRAALACPYTQPTCMRPVAACGRALGADMPSARLGACLGQGEARGWGACAAACP